MSIQAIYSTIVASAMALVATGCQDAKLHSYDSPQEAGEAFVAAMATKDWKTGFRCFTPEARDLAIAHLIVMTDYVAALDKKTGQADALFKEYGFDLAKAKEAAKAASIPAEAKQAKPDGKMAVKAFVDQINDKELLFITTLRWLDDNFGRGRKAGACALQKLKTTQDTATGDLKLAGPAYTVNFRKVDGQWLMALPEAEYRPSEWNGVFLIDFLDAMHGWKM